MSAHRQARHRTPSRRQIHEVQQMLVAIRAHYAGAGPDIPAATALDSDGLLETFGALLYEHLNHGGVGLSDALPALGITSTDDLLRWVRKCTALSATIALSFVLGEAPISADHVLYAATMSDVSLPPVAVFVAGRVVSDG